MLADVHGQEKPGQQAKEKVSINKEKYMRHPAAVMGTKSRPATKQLYYFRINDKCAHNETHNNHHPVRHKFIKQFHRILRIIFCKGSEK
jgi:hypothetical protein